VDCQARAKLGEQVSDDTGAGGLDMEIRHIANRASARPFHPVTP
jgi:hypothetical protein